LPQRNIVAYSFLTTMAEQPVVINHKGDFSNGISTIQCMYAPEFSSHSKRNTGKSVV
jgi:hypothetical protein